MTAKPEHLRATDLEPSGEVLLAFVHIPRTGGGTVSSAIARNYAPQRSPGNFQRGPDKTRQALETISSNPGHWQAVGDHVPYGLYLRYLPHDTRYVTILRDPVDRVLSHYHFHAQRGDPPGRHGPRKLKAVWEYALTLEAAEHEGIGDIEKARPVKLEEDAEFSLEEGLRRKIYLYDNFMTRFLWGGESLFGELPPDALERAKENISNFWFVGVRERLDESIVLLGRKLGVGLMPYWLRHVSQRRPPLEESSGELRDLIAEHNAFDVELYRFARERFEETAPAADDLSEDVEELRRRSKEVTDAAVAARAAKSEANKARQAGEVDSASAAGRGVRKAGGKGVVPKAQRREARAARGWSPTTGGSAPERIKAKHRPGGPGKPRTKQKTKNSEGSGPDPHQANDG